MLKKSVKIALEAILNDLRMNLENNYKDLAHDALKRLYAVLDQYLKEGVMKEKDYLRYKQVADTYAQSMVNYHH